MPDSIAPYRISWYDVGAGKIAVFFTLGCMILVSSSGTDDIDMNLEYWYCSFAACLSTGISPSGAERLASYTILLGCAVLWYGYTRLSRTSAACARHSCHVDRGARCRQRFLDSQFETRVILLSSGIAYAARSMRGGIRVTQRRRRIRRLSNGSFTSKYFGHLYRRVNLSTRLLCRYQRHYFCGFLRYLSALVGGGAQVPALGTTLQRHNVDPTAKLSGLTRICRCIFGLFALCVLCFDIAAYGYGSRTLRTGAVVSARIEDAGGKSIRTCLPLMKPVSVDCIDFYGLVTDENSEISGRFLGFFDGTSDCLAGARDGGLVASLEGDSCCCGSRPSSTGAAKPARFEAVGGKSIRTRHPSRKPVSTEFCDFYGSATDVHSETPGRFLGFFENTTDCPAGVRDGGPTANFEGPAANYEGDRCCCCGSRPSRTGAVTPADCLAGIRDGGPAAYWYEYCIPDATCWSGLVWRAISVLSLCLSCVCLAAMSVDGPTHTGDTVAHLSPVKELPKIASCLKIAQVTNLSYPLIDLRGGAKSPPADDANARLLAGLAALLKSASAARDSKTGPSSGKGSTAPPAKPKNRRGKRKSQRDDSLLGSLQRLVERMTKPEFNGDPLQRLQSFVSAAVKASSATPPSNHGAHAETKKSEPRRSRNADTGPRSKKQDKTPESEGRKTENKPRTYADVAKQARPAPPPATLCQVHWKGTLVSPDEFVAKVSNAQDGAHFITGVVDTIPAGFDGIMLPENSTATVVILPSTVTTLAKAEISAPAACARGNTRIHKLAYVQLGTPTFPLQWKPCASKACIIVEETCTLRAQMFSRYQKASDWTRIKARPREALRDLIIKLPQVNPDDLIDIFDFRRPDNDNQAFFSCTLRVKKHAVPKFVAASGHAGLLLKDFNPDSSVMWCKASEKEDGLAFLARVRGQSIEDGIPGVAISASGSIGLRRRKGEVASTFKISGFKCGTARSSILAFAAAHGWKEALVVSTSVRKHWVHVILKARPPEGNLQSPWS